MSETLLPCPFCGFTPDINDMDCIYQISRQTAVQAEVWNINCYETGGGCSAHILGDNPQDCINKWNTRK